MATVEELEAQLKLARLEEQLAAAKESGAGEATSHEEAESEEHQRYRDLKDQVRAARAEARQARDQNRTAPADGDAVATPDTHGMGVSPQEV